MFPISRSRITTPAAWFQHSLVVTLVAALLRYWSQRSWADTVTTPAHLCNSATLVTTLWHLVQRSGTGHNTVALVTPNALTLVTVLRHLSQRSFSNCHSSAALVRTLQHLSTQRSRTAALIATLWHWLQHWHTGHIAAAYIYPMVGPKQCNGQDQCLAHTTSNRGDNTSATVDFCSNKNNKSTLKVQCCAGRWLQQGSILNKLLLLLHLFSPNNLEPKNEKCCHQL